MAFELTQKSKDMITMWAKGNGTPALADILISAAGRSSYLTGQFNKFQRDGGAFKVSDDQKGEGTYAQGMVIFISPKMVNADLDITGNKLATLFAHEMGHALSLGGQAVGKAKNPDEAAANSAVHEGVGLASEVLVGLQLQLGKNGQFSHSDYGQFTTTGNLAKLFSSLLLGRDVNTLNFESKEANEFIQPRTETVKTFGELSGFGNPSVAPYLNYNQWKAYEWVIENCTSINSSTIDWAKIYPEDIVYSYEAGVCKVTTPKSLPRVLGYENESVIINAVISGSGAIVESKIEFDTNGDGKADKTFINTALSPEISLLKESNANGKPTQVSIMFDLNRDGAYERVMQIGTSQAALLDAEKQVQNMYKLGQLGSGTYGIFTDWAAQQAVSVTPVFTYVPGYTYTPGYGMPDTSPIGAFYESKSAGSDNAASVAKKTFRILNSAGVAMTTVQLASYDRNNDGKISGTELNGLYAWSDVNEDGVLNSSVTASNEMTSLREALTADGQDKLLGSDYLFYTSGNGNFQTLAKAGAMVPVNTFVPPAALDSNYAHLRSTDNRFMISPTSWIDWSPSQIKIASNQLSMIGTDADDDFGINWYSAYDGRFFNLGLIQNFFAGGGNDVMSGSGRSDNLWGGTGNDVLYGYGGHDRVFGEEGNDELQGGDGNDLLDGGTGSDRLFGEVGDDVMVGGDGDDILLGFMGSNSAKKALAAGETDNDRMFGGDGADRMYGGLGDDLMDGGTGNDFLKGDEGNDALDGGAGDDELNGCEGNDILNGGAGIDKLFGGSGDDQMWGGDGADIMVGFTPSNDMKQTLAAGESDNDVMYGGAGDDLMLGASGNDQMFGGSGNDEVQGQDGSDQVYGNEGDDRLFGGAGDDTIYGGDGNDLIVGGVANNEAALAAGARDSNFLYGGAGNDTIVGGIGNDYIDGGAGADDMEGGKGSDIYIVNSFNDVVLEQQNEGYDTVISSSNYILNANIEELRLLEGAMINGTGNRLDNKIIGNGQDNILDGVTGADVMLGGAGNDTYYIDNTGDHAAELTSEGIDTVNASISYTLEANLENLTLLDFSKAEKGVAEGINILVYGYPMAFELDYMQGNAVAGYKGTCALTSIANLATQAGRELSEGDVVQKAIDKQWCVTGLAKTEYQRGGSNYIGQQALLDSYGIRNGIVMGYNEMAIANLIKGGRGVMIGVNSGKLWGESASGKGGVDHVVTVTGVACDAATGAINGFYIADSGRGLVSDMTRYISLADFRADANVQGAYSIYTIEPIKLWEENINATGNELDNVLTGNRGDNILSGGRGNDILIGGTGNDSYKFARGDGQDIVVDADSTSGNKDVLQLTDINQNNLWFKHIGNDLQIKVMGTADQIVVKDWYLDSLSASNQIELIKTADGLVMGNADVERLTQAMAAFAPPSAAQTSWTNGQSSNGQVLLTVSR